MSAAIETIALLLIFDLYERIDVLRERDEGHAVRLHNFYFTTARLRSEKDGIMQKSVGGKARRCEDKMGYQAYLDRIRSEREKYRLEMERYQQELKDYKAKDVETVEGMWAAYTKPVKVGMLPTNEQQQAEGIGSKRKTEEQGSKEALDQGRFVIQ